jgi:hypothetical protein
LVFSDLSWFDHSEEERSQSRLARRLIAIKYRRPLLYVASGGSEFWDTNGELVCAMESDTQFGVWDLSVPSLKACSLNKWTPPDESWPLCVFATLFLWRLFLARLKRTKLSHRLPAT